jgi:hypothetical protein
MSKKQSQAKVPAKPAAQPPHGALVALSGIYNGIPKVPLLDRETSAIFYACILAFLLFFIYAMLSPMDEKYDFTLTETPLYKNANLSLSAGENFSYVIEHEGQRQMMDYSVRRLWGCKGVVLYEGNESQECLLPNGNVDGDAAQRNSTLGNSTGLLFLPWMLAVSDNFSWKASGEYSNGYVSMRSSMNYSSLGKSSALGRDAYLVRVVSDIYPVPADYYIDSEKRVLLYIRSGNTTAWLVEAPFGLDASQIPEKQ